MLWKTSADYGRIVSPRSAYQKMMAQEGDTSPYLTELELETKFSDSKTGVLLIMLQYFLKREIRETNKTVFKDKGKERLGQRACETLWTIMDWCLLAPLEPQVDPWYLDRGDDPLLEKGRLNTACFLISEPPCSLQPTSQSTNSSPEGVWWICSVLIFHSAHRKSPLLNRYCHQNKKWALPENQEKLF